MQIDRRLLPRLVVRVMSVLAIVIAALTSVACSGGDHESTTTAPATTLPNSKFEALVRERAKEERPVKNVLCQVFTDELVMCAVIFVGPSCQLWTLQSGEPPVILPLIEGISASRSAKGVGCLP